MLGRAAIFNCDRTVHGTCLVPFVPLLFMDTFPNVVSVCRREYRESSKGAKLMLRLVYKGRLQHLPQGKLTRESGDRSSENERIAQRERDRGRQELSAVQGLRVKQKRTAWGRGGGERECAGEDSKRSTGLEIEENARAIDLPLKWQPYFFSSCLLGTTPTTPTDRRNYLHGY